MAAVGTYPIGTGAIAGGFVRSAPIVAITVPLGGTVTSTPVTVTWTYTTLTGRVQTRYRVRLLSQDGTVVLYDTSDVLSAAVTMQLVMELSGGSSYLLGVSAFDGADWSIEDQVPLFYDAPDPGDFPDEPRVGSVYEVGINGVGYMLSDAPGGQNKYQRRVIPLDPQRLATGDTPFSEAIDRYTMIGHIDWSDGAGQKLADRDSSTPRAYRDSDGINPFDPGQLKLLPGCTRIHTSTHTWQKAVVASNKLYMVTGNNTLAMLDDPTDTSASTFTIAAGGTVKDFVTDGTRWYWCDGTGIWAGATAADPGAVLSASNAEVMAWCSDRLIFARNDGTSTTPNVVCVMNYATGGEVATPWSYEVETDVRSITSGDGYAWWAAARYDKSVVYAWQLGATTAPTVALELPAGQDIRSIGFYQGSVFIRATEQTASSAKRAIIYQAATDAGRLTPVRVLEIADTTVDHSVGAFAGDDRFVHFSWKTVDTYSGIGCIDLSTGGWTKWLVAPGGTGIARSICQWYGRTVFCVDGYGVIIENTEAAGDDGSRSSGTLETSVSDLRTSMRKAIHRLEAGFAPLPAGASIGVAYSTDGGNSFVTLDNVTTVGARAASWDLSVETDSISLKVTLNKGTLVTPVLHTLTLRVHPIGLADQILILPINCADQTAGLNNRTLTESGPGAGARRARTLETLVQTLVRVQDVDWRLTGTAHMYDVVACETESVGVADRHVGRQSQDMRATLTLRRAYR